MQLVWSIYNVAGSGSSSYSGDGGAANSAGITYPGGVAVDLAGNVYLSDSSANRIRKITAATGVITTIAGTGSAGFSGDGGQANVAAINFPTGLAVDLAGDVYFADTDNYRIREIVAATGKIATVAGTGTASSSGDGGAATSATLNFPTGVTLDGAGNIYTAETNGQRIRKILVSTGKISTVAGTGTAGYNGDGIAATSAKLSGPSGIAVDPVGNLYISDDNNNRVREVAALNGLISTLVGNGTAGYGGDGGVATSAMVHTPYGLAVDDAGNLFIADAYNQRIRKLTVSTGYITTVAGNGTAGFTGNNGAAINAELNTPNDMTMDIFGNLYIADTGNHRVRRLGLNTSFPQTAVGATSPTQTFLVQTMAAETISSISAVTSLGGVKELTVGSVTGCTVNGVTVVAANTACSVPVTFSPAYPGQRLVPLKITTSTGTITFGLPGVGSSGLAQLMPGIISTYAGTAIAGYSGDGGAATSAKLDQPRQMAFDISGNLFIADQLNNVVRKVTTAGVISTFAGNSTAGFMGDGGAATSAELSAPSALTVDMAGNVYIADTGNNRVREVNASTGIIATMAGTGTAASTGDGASATSAALNQPDGLATDSSGNIYIAERAGARVREVNAVAGAIVTIAGTGTAGYSGDGGAATSAEVNEPAGLATDALNNVYIADPGSNVVRKLTYATGLISTVAGDGFPGDSGDGGAATSASLDAPQAVSVDPGGNVLIADNGNSLIRRVVAGIIETVAGNGTAGNSGDGGTATAASLNGPSGIALDPTGNLYIASSGANVVRKIATSTSTLSFSTATPYQSVDSTDGAQVVRLANAGNAALTLNTPSSGTNPSLPSSFILDGETNCPVLTSSSSAQSIASGTECEYAVDLFPASIGSLNGSLTLTDQSLNAASATQQVNMTGAGVTVNTSTTLSSSVNPSTYGNTVTFTATAAPLNGSGVPSGTATFSIDGVTACSAIALVNGSATCSASALAMGSHVVNVGYSSASGNFSSSTSSAFTQTVTQTAPVVMLNTSNASTSYGTPITITAALPAMATGTVTFYDGAAVLGTATLASGSSSITTASLTAGSHSLSAVYSGDANYASATASPISETVSRSAVSIALTSSRSPSLFGDSVTINAVFTGSQASPTGTAVLKDGANTLGTLTLDASGHATFTSSALLAGAHT